MAVSLALNWKLPASTPLFDDETEGSGLPLRESKANLTSTPFPESSDASTSGRDAASSPEATPSRGQKQQSHSASSTNAGAKSYAAAVSSTSQQQPSFPQVPMPSYGGVGLSGQHNYSAFGNGNPSQPYAKASTWSGTFQPGPPPSKALVSEDGRRLRTTSGPQKSSHLTYNDTLQHYPGALPLQHGRNANNVLSSNLPHSSSSPSLGSSSSAGATGASGYHPYRRAMKGSDASQQASLHAFGQGAPSLPMPGLAPSALTATQQVNLPQSPPRIRSSSTNSGGTARETATTRGTLPISTTYSSIASSSPVNSLDQSSPRDQNANIPPSYQQAPARPYEPTRQGSTTSSEAGPTRWDAAGSTESFATADNRSRTNSVSSTSSAKERVSPSASAPTAASIGRSTPLPRKPLPSPLSRTKPFSDEDDGAARSDDENTIGGRTTPTPGDKPKKGMSKLRKALSLSTLQQVEAAAAAPDRAYGGRTNVSTKRPDGTPYPHSSLETNGSSGSTRSTSPPHTPDNGAPLPGSSGASISSRRSTRPPISGADGGPKRSIFNRKFNSSTDNISISSTVSSASMMLRKVGNLGKLARRSNIMGITNMFNKDKEDGRSGLHNDDFGTVQTSSQSDGTKVVSIASQAKAAAKKEKSNAKAAKKGTPAAASVSHATVELETSPSQTSLSGDSSMTPAASYVRQHQMQMRAEAERVAREKAEAERLAAVAAASMRIKTKTTDDVAEGRQKMIEKEKERLKSKRGWRKRLVGSLGSSSEVQQVTGLETIPIDDSSMDASVSSQPVVGGYNVPGSVLSVGAQPQLGRSANFHDASFDSAFDEDDLEPPHMPSAAEGYESGDDFETDSLRHWGEGIERSRESAAKIKSVKSILKNNATLNVQSPGGGGDSGGREQQRSGSLAMPERPFASRLRANSYDAPQNSSSSASSVPLMSQISTSASTDRVDGVARLDDDRSGTPDERSGSGAATPTQGIGGGSGNSNLGHHANTSMPTLSLMMQPSPTGQRSITTPTSRKRLAFAEAHIYHSTWPAHVYDRRGELATCNRLTPLLAQRIKEELNTYKMEEMAVAPSSRIHTHFFV